MEHFPEPKFKLGQPGADTVVDYRLFGEFRNIGTSSYEFVIKDRERLAAAVGEGIYPHVDDFSENSYYQGIKTKGLLDVNVWERLYTSHCQADFFAWVTAKDIDAGVKQFFIGETLRHAGLIVQAVKAFYAALIHFPKSICWSNDQKSFFWFVGQAAIVKINHLCRQYPQLGVKMEGADFHINGHREFPLRNVEIKNEAIEVMPGFFVPWDREERLKTEVDIKKLAVQKTVGSGKVQLVQFSNRHWQIRVEGNPFFVKGMTYNPTKVGETPFQETLQKFPQAEKLQSWMWQDTNKNGIIDAPYESWVDKNRNKIQDPDEMPIGDFKLLKEMGCNCVRIYHLPENNSYNEKYINKALLRDLFSTYGIRVALGDFLGAYTIGAGAGEGQITDYSDARQRKIMKDIIEALVLDNKNEPYLLMWIIGNENNLPDTMSINSVKTNAYENPIPYVTFINEIAVFIHSIDPDHPVAVSNNDVVHLSYFRDLAPDVDIFGVNAYKGPDGFGELWQQVYRFYDKPVLITEYGCDCYHPGQGVNEGEQALYHEACWKDILFNRAGRGGYGNSIGGIAFQWLDEWWKAGRDKSPFEHDTEHNHVFIMPDGTISEEWFGICGQGDGNNSPFLRELRRSYYLYKTMWNDWPL